MEYDPVCSYAGTTYSNACSARCAGVMYMPGKCPDSIGSSKTMEPTADAQADASGSLARGVPADGFDLLAAAPGAGAGAAPALLMLGAPRKKSKQSSMEAMGIVLIVLSATMLTAILAVMYVRARRAGDAGARRFSNFASNRAFDYGPDSPMASPSFGANTLEASGPAVFTPESISKELAMRSTSGADALEFAQRGSLDSCGMEGEEHAVVVTRSPLFEAGEHTAADAAGGRRQVRGGDLI